MNTKTPDWQVKVFRYRKMMKDQAQNPPTADDKNVPVDSWADSLDWARAMKGCVSLTQVQEMWDRNPGRTHDWAEVARAYNGD